MEIYHDHRTYYGFFEVTSENTILKYKTYGYYIFPGNEEILNVDIILISENINGEYQPSLKNKMIDDHQATISEVPNPIKTVDRTEQMSRYGSNLIFDDSKSKLQNSKEKNDERTNCEFDQSSNSYSNDNSKCRKLWDRTVLFYWDNEFVILVVVAILLARAYPPLGAVYLAPQITSDWIAVIFIFSK